MGAYAPEYAEVDHPGIPGANNQWFPSQLQARRAALQAATRAGLGYGIEHHPHPRVGLPHYHLRLPNGVLPQGWGHFFYGRRPPRKEPRGRGQREFEGESELESALHAINRAVDRAARQAGAEYAQAPPNGAPPPPRTRRPGQRARRPMSYGGPGTSGSRRRLGPPAGPDGAFVRQELTVARGELQRALAELGREQTAAADAAFGLVMRAMRRLQAIAVYEPANRNVHRQRAVGALQSALRPENWQVRHRRESALTSAARDITLAIRTIR